MDKKPERVGFITTMYGLTAVLTVFGHSHPIHCGYPDVLRSLTEFIYCFHMPCFFYIAGFLIHHTGEGRRISKWWAEKCRRLLFPYVVLTLLAWLPKMLLGEIMTDRVDLSFHTTVRILLMPRAGIWGHFWFIPVYLLLSFAGAIWLKLWKQYPSYVLWPSLILAIYLNIHPIQVDWLGLRDISENCVYVLLGIVTYSTEYSRGQADTLLKGTACLILSCALFFCFPFYFIKKAVSICMIYVMLCFGRYTDKIQLKWLDYIGRHAFIIFIYSWPIQAVAEILAVIFLNCGWRTVYPVMFACGLAGPLILWEIYSRKMEQNRFIDRMMGVR